jgi:hypothetical protein
VIGSKCVIDTSSNQLRASNKPKEFHLYVGNLDVNSTEDQVKENLLPHSIRILSCNIIRSSRYSDVRSVSAHLVIDAKDKDKAFSSDIWPSDALIRPWRQQRKANYWSSGNMNGDYNDE